MSKQIWCFSVLMVAGYILMVSGCASTNVEPSKLVAPEPILGNTGKYMCPYRQDGSMADWSNQAITSVLGAEAGKRAGFMLGTKVFGGASILAKKAGKVAGRELVLRATGGMEKIRKSSDLSFNKLEDLAVYIYVKHSKDKNFKKALRIMRDLYPDFKNAYKRGIARAKAKADMKAAGLIKK